jgi:hypothetical protein
MAFQTDFWASGYNLPAGATHHWYQEIEDHYGFMEWFAAQPVFGDKYDPEVSLAVKVFYLKLANSNQLQVHVLVENIGVSPAWGYVIYFASNE